MAKKTNDQTEKKLLDCGYCRFKPSPFDGENVTDCYQKAFRDEDDNRKYFLTYHRWDFSQYAYRCHDPNLNKPSYEAETQLTTKNGGVLNITFLSQWEPEDAEEFLAKLFETGWFKKYDDEY